MYAGEKIFCKERLIENIIRRLIKNSEKGLDERTLCWSSASGP